MSKSNNNIPESLLTEAYNLSEANLDFLQKCKAFLNEESDSSSVKYGSLLDSLRREDCIIYEHELSVLRKQYRDQNDRVLKLSTENALLRKEIKNLKAILDKVEQ